MVFHFDLEFLDKLLVDNSVEVLLVPYSDFSEGPQPMEEEETQTNKRLFKWRIGNFSSLNPKEKHYSDVFTADGKYKWRVVLIFPKGYSVDHHLSMYLDAADSSTLRNGWIRCTEFSLAVVNQLHNNNNNKKNKKVRKQDTHQFTAQESVRGFTDFMPLSELYDPHRGFLMNDTLLVEAYVDVRKVVDYWTYDSKKETGYVGLRNVKATWFMNSVLQILYHIPYLRKALHDMPITENDIPSISVPLALRNLFYQLQYSDNSVATKELIKVLYSDEYNTFIYCDVPKFSRFLHQMLENKMKETIQWLFEGHREDYVECTNVDHKLIKNVSFYDIELDVQGCRDVYTSFDKYVKVERLEGDYQYYSEQHGWQDATKGVRFIDFPPVLQLQLQRFIRHGNGMVKINDRYEFPLELDLDRENKKYFLPGANSVRNLYTLHSVLVHSGSVPSPRNYAFIRPTLSDQWFKFVDKWVTKEDMKGALEELYGGEEKTATAYRLVYIRESDKKKILGNTDEKDIAEHLRKEQKEKEHKKKEKEKAEARLCTIKVARNEDLLDQIGKEIHFDLVDHDKVSSLRVEKQMPFHIFKEGVAKKLGVPVEYQRFWLWAKRPNHTYRPHRPLTYHEETLPVEKLITMTGAPNDELNLFLEVEFGLDSRPIAPPKKTKEDILLFFKFCDLVKQELRFVGWLFVKGNGEPAEILTRINKLAGFNPYEEIELYEEINFEPSVLCRHIDKKQTFQTSKLQDGDIICFQKSQQDCSYDVPSFLESIHGFKPVRNPRSRRRQLKKSGGRR